MVKYCFIDTETTGLTNKHAVIQIAGAIAEIDKDKREIKILKRFSFNVRPIKGDLCSPEALEVNRKTMPEIESYEEANKIHSQFTALLGAYCDKFDKKDKMFFVGYNSQFDSDMMRAWFDKCGDKYFGSWFWNPVKDVMQMALDYLEDHRNEMENFRLSTVAKFMGIIVSGELHDAGTDISLTIEIYSKIKGYDVK